MNASQIILLVNRSATERATYRHWLKQEAQHTYTFLEAAAGDTALVACQQTMPDIVVLDDRLPDRNGLDVLRQLKQQADWQHRPIVILTEQEDVAAAVRAMKDGAQDYLVKQTLTAARFCCVVNDAIAWRQQQLALTLAEAQLEPDRMSVDRPSLKNEPHQTTSFRYSEAANCALIQAIPDLLIRMTRAGVCLDIISGGAVQGAYLAEAAQDNATFTALFPDLTKQKLYYIQKALETGDLQIYEQEIQLNGSSHFEEVRIVPSGQDEVLIIVRDITKQHATLLELQQAEASLQQNAATNRAIFEVIPDVLVRMSRDGHCLAFLTGSNNQTFYPQGAVPGKSITEYLPTALAEQRLHAIQLALETGDLQVYEQEIQVAERLRVEEVRIVPNGTDEVLVIVRDISERKQVEAALRQSEATNRALIAAIPDLLIRVKPNGTYLDIAGRDRLEVQNSDCFSIGSNVYDSLPADQANLRMAYIQKALDTGTVQVYEQQFVVEGQTQYEEVRVIVSRDNELLIIVRDITERKRTEAERKQVEIALQASEARFHAFMNNSPAASWITDVDGQMLYVSQTYCQTFNLHTENLIGKTVFELYPAEIAQQFLDNIRRVAETGQGMEIIESAPTRGGKIGEFLVYKFPLQEIVGQRLIGGVAIDITKRLQAEQALRQLNQELEQRVEQRTAALQASEAVLQAVFNQAAVGINLTRPDGHYLKVNQTFCNIVGYTAEELLQINFSQVTHPEDVEKGWQERRRLFAGEIYSFSLEKRYRRKDGSLIWVSLSVSAVYKASSEVDYAIAIVEDISERKQAEEQLRQQLEREVLVATITQRIRESLNLSTILNTTVAEIQQIFQADRVFVHRLLTNGSGQTVAESRTPDSQPMLEVGYTCEAFLPDCYDRYIQGHVCVLPHCDQDHTSPCKAQSMQEFAIQAKLIAPIVHQEVLWGLLVVHECRVPREWQDWEVQLLKQLANQLAIATKQSQLYQQLQLELREREKTQLLLQQVNQRLRTSNLKLAEATRHKDEFLANMSHELRTPLNAILGMSEALLDQICGPLTERQQKAIATIEKSGTHLLALINDILDLAKIEAGKLELYITSVAIATLCDTSLAFVEPMAQQKNLQLIVQIPPDIGYIQADDRRLQQVLINLLSNAVKFTPVGGSVTLKVWLDTQPPTPHTLHPTPHTLNLSVIDTGIGIPHEAFDQIFQPFKQLDSSLSRQYTGTGLGLTLVRRIIDLHQGIITVDSTIGQGSRFTVRLPQHLMTPVSSDVNPSS